MLETHNNKGLLPPIKRSIRDCCSYDVQSGYSKRSRTRPKLHTQVRQSERELLFDIKNLDDVLNKKMVYIDGLLFTSEVTQRLIQCIHEELRRSKGVFDMECFGSILQNPEEEIQAEVSVYRRIRTLGKQNQISYYESKLNQSIHPRTEHSDLSTPVAKSKGSSGNVLSVADLERFIRKQDRTVSVWLPPTSYPQFCGFMNIGKVRTHKKTNQRVMHIQRLYVPRYMNPHKMFRPLLDYLSKELRQPITTLQLQTSKQNYHCRFKKWGWKLRAIMEQKYRLWWEEDEQNFQ